MRRIALAIVLLGLCALVVAPAAATAAAPWKSTKLADPREPFKSDVAVNDRGTAAVVWLQFDASRTSGGRSVARSSVHAKFRTPGGNWGTNQHLERGPLTQAFDPQIAIAPDGTAVAVWTQRVNLGGARIWAAVRRPGHAFATPVELGRSTHFAEADPQVAVDPEGDFTIVWIGAARDAKGKVVAAPQFAQRRAGHGFGSAHTIAAENAVDIRLAVDPKGRTAWAAWTRPTTTPTVRYARRGAGRSFGSARTLPGSPSSRPALAAGPDGTVALAVRRARNDSEGNGIQNGAVAVALRAPGGTRFGDPQLVSVAGQETPNVLVAAGRDGETVAVWPGMEADPGPPPGPFEAVRPPGGAFAPAFALPGFGADDLVSAPDGTFVLGWHDNNGTRASLRPPGGAFGAPESPGSTTPGGGLVALAAARGVVVATWVDGSRVWASARPLP
jgi:hypothetical protein